MNEERRTWLASLKVGDTVAIDRGGRSADMRYELGTVTGFTPSGSIRVSERLFHKDGHEKGRHSYSNLRPVTPSVEDALKRREILRFYDYDFSPRKVTTEALEKAREILKGALITDESETSN